MSQDPSKPNSPSDNSVDITIILIGSEYGPPKRTIPDLLTGDEPTEQGRDLLTGEDEIYKLTEGKDGERFVRNLLTGKMEAARGTDTRVGAEDLLSEPYTTTATLEGPVEDYSDGTSSVATVIQTDLLQLQGEPDLVEVTKEPIGQEYNTRQAKLLQHPKDNETIPLGKGATLPTQNRVSGLPAPPKQSGPSIIFDGKIKSAYGLEREKEFMDEVKSGNPEIQLGFEYFRKRKAKEIQEGSDPKRQNSSKDRSNRYTSEFRRNGESVLRARREAARSYERRYAQGYGEDHWRRPHDSERKRYSGSRSVVDAHDNHERYSGSNRGRNSWRENYNDTDGYHRDRLERKRSRVSESHALFSSIYC